MGTLVNVPGQDSQKSLHIRAGAYSSCLNLCFSFSEMLLSGCISALLLPIDCKGSGETFHEMYPKLLPVCWEKECWMCLDECISLLCLQMSIGHGKETVQRRAHSKSMGTPWQSGEKAQVYII